MLPQASSLSSHDQAAQFLPISIPEAKNLGIDQFDIILVSGDAYVDHPSFGAGLLGRILWDAGHTVGIIAQPDLKRDDDLLFLGRPRLFFGITSGNVDSMVNNLTPNLRRRSRDVRSGTPAFFSNLPSVDSSLVIFMGQ